MVRRNEVRLWMVRRNETRLVRENVSFVWYSKIIAMNTANSTWLSSTLAVVSLSLSFIQLHDGKFRNGDITANTVRFL